MAGFGVPETHFKIDLTIARGLDYYTGTVYETHLLDHPEIGSICSGGRYDNLAGYYTDRKLPGVGLSIGLTRLFFVLQDQGYLSPSLLTAPADVLVIPMTEDFAPAVQLATALREAGLRTQIYSENKKFKARLQYADKLGIPFVVFLGEDEINSGKITVKDMASGEQTTASPTMLISGMLQRVAALREGAPIRDKGGE
jgi:histidyl-tRNA synthetase